MNTFLYKHTVYTFGLDIDNHVELDVSYVLHDLCRMWGNVSWEISVDEFEGNLVEVTVRINDVKNVLSEDFVCGLVNKLVSDLVRKGLDITFCEVGVI